MMDKEEILAIAKKKGLANKEFIEKDYYIDVILKEIFERSDKLVFKGGTALYKIYGFPRFSEDLDFALSSNGAVVDIESIISDIAAKYSFDMAAKKIRNTLLFKIKLKGFLTRINTLKIDFSLDNPSISFKNYSYVSDYIDIPPFICVVMNKDEILAEKIHAIFNRTKARDMYDLFYLLRSETINLDIVKAKVPGFTFNELKGLTNKYENLWEPEIKKFSMQYVDYKVAKEYILNKIS